MGKIIGRRPTLPHTCACSTIGAERLNCRVRDGNGWDPLAVITRNLVRNPRREHERPAVGFDSKSVGGNRFDEQPGLRLLVFNSEKRVHFMVKPNELLVTVSSTHYCAYTSVLST